MSEPRGEIRLRRLTETARLEEVWVYIPRIREWHEIGIKEGTEVVDEKDPRYKKRGVDFEGDYLNALAKRFKEFTLYHNHNLKRRVDSEVMSYHPQSSLPSYEDLWIDLKIETFYDKLNEGHRIRFKSVSPFGVTEVKFSQYARDHFEELATEAEAIRADLTGFETFDCYKPAHFSIFRGSIDIYYKPLTKRSAPTESSPRPDTPLPRLPPLGGGRNTR
jgi:hypothetical protein